MPKAIHPYEVIVRPIVTEKSTMLSGLDKYVFEVMSGANKSQIKEAVEKAFNVTVTNVHTMNMKGEGRRVGKNRRLVTTPGWKKAVVTLQEGDKIEVFQGI